MAEDDREAGRSVAEMLTWMRAAYAVLGLAFFVLIGGTYLLVSNMEKHSASNSTGNTSSSSMSALAETSTSSDIEEQIGSISPLMDSNISQKNTDENSLSGTTASRLILESVFSEGKMIPQKYTCDGDNVSPPITIRGVPSGANSLVLILEDPDIPQQVKDSMGIEVFDHWVLFNISPDVENIHEGDAPSGALEGNNSSGKRGYTGPCPPKDFEPTTHRYVFTLYALDSILHADAGVTKEEIIQLLTPHIIQQTTLTGMFNRKL